MIETVVQSIILLDLSAETVEVKALETIVLIEKTTGLVVDGNISLDIVINATANANFNRGQVVRVGNGVAYSTGYSDPLSATWQLGLVTEHVLAGASFSVQISGVFTDVVYSNLVPGRIWLGSSIQLYAVQTPPPNTTGFVQAVLGNCAGNGILSLNMDSPSIFSGV